MSDLASSILDVLTSTIGSGPHGLHEPTLGELEKDYLIDCLSSGYVSSVGSYVDAFEKKLAELVGCNFAVACVNGTAALQLALKVCGVKPGDEVILPTLTFVATANAISHLGAIPHFVDCEFESLGIDPLALRSHLEDIGRLKSGNLYNRITNRKITALLPVHIFGHCADVENLISIANEFQIPIIEDASEALGSFLGRKHAGTFGSCGVFSFNGNKIVTTGGGGAVVTDNELLARQLKHLSTTAKAPHPWRYWHDEVGFNFRMPNLNAALGCAQLEKLSSLIASKRLLAARYSEAFNAIDGVNFFVEPPNRKSNYWLQAISVDVSAIEERDEILGFLNENGFMSRPTWDLLHSLPMYRNCPVAKVDVAKVIHKQFINIPSSPFLVL